MGKNREKDRCSGRGRCFVGSKMATCKEKKNVDISWKLPDLTMSRLADYFAVVGYDHDKAREYSNTEN